MDRRSFLKTSALGGSAAAATTLAAPAYAQGKRTLTMVTSWPRGMAGVHDAAEYLKSSVDTMSGGDLIIDIKSAGELVGALEVFDAVTAGQADIYHSADYYYMGQHPAYAFFTAVPFGMTPQETMNWYYHAGGMELHDELGQIFGIKPFLGGNTGPQSGGWFSKPIEKPADFEGLRFRMPGQGGQVLAKLGASVQTIPGGEIYQALSSGALDGTDWLGPWADEKAGFQEVVKVYYPAGFQEPGAALTVGTNRETYEGLSPAHQAIIKSAALETHQWSLAQFLHNNALALKRLASSGVRLETFPEVVWDAFGKASKEVREAYLDDELYKKVHDSYFKSLKSDTTWLGLALGDYRAQRDRVMGG